MYWCVVFFFRVKLPYQHMAAVLVFLTSTCIQATASTESVAVDCGPQPKRLSKYISFYSLISRYV